MYPTFYASNKVTVEQAKQHIWWDIHVQYNGGTPGGPSYDELSKIEKQFSESIAGNVAVLDSIQTKRSAQDFLWIDEQIITFELIDAVRGVVKVIGYGESLAEFLSDHIGWVLWWNLE